jgi:hypothetical protein
MLFIAKSCPKDATSDAYGAEKIVEIFPGVSRASSVHGAN